MYQIHTTPGFIIDSWPYGEAGRILSILSRDFGLVRAVAQGVRLEKSKLRYHAESYSFGIFSLVRGKEFWRLTSAQEIQELDRITGSGLQLMARLADLAGRFLHGEDLQPKLFEIVSECARFLKENDTGLSEQRSQTLESIAVIRILNELGYIGDNAEFNESAAKDPFSVRLLDELASKRLKINRIVNKGLKESQM